MTNEKLISQLRSRIATICNDIANGPEGLILSLMHEANSKCSMHYFTLGILANLICLKNDIGGNFEDNEFKIIGTLNLDARYELIQELYKKGECV